MWVILDDVTLGGSCQDQVIRHLSSSGPSFHQHPLPSLTWTRRSLAGQRAMIYNLQRVLLSVSRVLGMVCELLFSASERLLSRAGNDEERARLLSVSTKESGAWLRALPVSALGLRVDDDTVRVAVGMRLGTAICGPHSCQRCGSAVLSI